MAKKSMIAREVKRKKLVKKYAAKRKSLLDEFNSAKENKSKAEQDVIEKKKLCSTTCK